MQRWRHLTGADVVSSVTASASTRDESVYVGSSDGFLYSLFAHSGALNWKQRLGDSAVSSPTADGDVVYVGSASKEGGGQMHALRQRDGASLWFFRTNKWITTKVNDAPVSNDLSEGLAWVCLQCTVFWEVPANDKL